MQSIMFYSTTYASPLGSITLASDGENIVGLWNDGQKYFAASVKGEAVGRNPISIIIPCHRVIGARGSLTGYAGGISKKIKLLQLEGVDTSKFSTPNKGTAL